MALWVLGKPGLCSEFQDSQGYVERLCLKKSKQKIFLKEYQLYANKIISVFSYLFPFGICNLASAFLLYLSVSRCQGFYYIYWVIAGV